MSEILITGGSGMLGKAICAELQAQGKDFAILSRSPKHAEYHAFFWDPYNKEIDDACFDGLKTIIHLAGAGIADQRWTTRRKEEIIRSRTETSEFLLSRVKEMQVPIEAFISASGINYYGIEPTDKIYTETDQIGNDFTAQVVGQWEQAADEWQELCRVVKLRISVVLDKDGGALKRLATPIKFWIGAPLGSGKQWVPWVHKEDVTRAFFFAMENSGMNGSYNLVAPAHSTNRELTKTLGKVLKKPVFIPFVPGFILYLIFGKLAELVLKGNRASSEKLQKAGFQFKFPNLKGALESLY